MTSMMEQIESPPSKKKKISELKNRLFENVQLKVRKRIKKILKILGHQEHNKYQQGLEIFQRAGKHIQGYNDKKTPKPRERYAYSGTGGTIQPSLSGHILQSSPSSVTIGEYPVRSNSRKSKSEF